MVNRRLQVKEDTRLTFYKLMAVTGIYMNVKAGFRGASMSEIEAAKRES
jgi:hypothetical protein